MRAWLAIAAGVALGIGCAWWFAHEAPPPDRAPPRSAGPVAGRTAAPSLYRWRDDAGVLQITETPPEGRPFERIARDAPPGIRVHGDAPVTDD